MLPFHGRYYVVWFVSDGLPQYIVNETHVVSSRAHAARFTELEAEWFTDHGFMYDDFYEQCFSEESY